jgi:hypothetical protein
MELLKHKPQLAVAQVGQLVVVERFHLGAVQAVAAAGGAIQAAQDVHGRALA